MKNKLLFVVFLLVPFAALPQTLDGGVAVAGTVATQAATESPSEMLWKAGLALFLTILSVLVGTVTKAVLAYASTSKYGNVITQLWMLVQTTVSHAEAEVKPTLMEAAKDGKLTPEEGQKLKALVMASLKRDSMTQLTTLARSFGLSEEAASTMLSGLIERAVSLMKTPGLSALSSSPSGIQSLPTPAPILPQVNP